MPGNEDDEDLDIYSDLPNFQYDETIKKLETANKCLENKLATLQKDFEALTKQNKKLESINKALSSNISSLFKTATSEIKRKERMIDELRREKDSIVFRRAKKHDKHEEPDGKHQQNSDLKRNRQVHETPERPSDYDDHWDGWEEQYDSRAVSQSDEFAAYQAWQNECATFGASTSVKKSHTTLFGARCNAKLTRNNSNIDKKLLPKKQLTEVPLTASKLSLASYSVCENNSIIPTTANTTITTHTTASSTSVIAGTTTTITNSATTITPVPTTACNIIAITTPAITSSTTTIVTPVSNTSTITTYSTATDTPGIPTCNTINITPDVIVCSTTTITSAVTTCSPTSSPVSHSRSSTTNTTTNATNTCSTTTITSAVTTCSSTTSPVIHSRSSTTNTTNATITPPNSSNDGGHSRSSTTNTTNATITPPNSSNDGGDVTCARYNKPTSIHLHSTPPQSKLRSIPAKLLSVSKSVPFLSPLAKTPNIVPFLSPLATTPTTIPSSDTKNSTSAGPTTENEDHSSKNSKCSVGTDRYNVKSNGRLISSNYRIPKRATLSNVKIMNNLKSKYSTSRRERSKSRTPCRSPGPLRRSPRHDFENPVSNFRSEKQSRLPFTKKDSVQFVKKQENSKSKIMDGEVHAKSSDITNSSTSEVPTQLVQSSTVKCPLPLYMGSPPCQDSTKSLHRVISPNLNVHAEALQPTQNTPFNSLASKISPTYKDPAIVKDQKVSMCFFNEQCDFKRKRVRLKFCGQSSSPEEAKVPSTNSQNGVLEDKASEVSCKVMQTNGVKRRLDELVNPECKVLKIEPSSSRSTLVQNLKKNNTDSQFEENVEPNGQQLNFSSKDRTDKTSKECVDENAKNIAKQLEEGEIDDGDLPKHDKESKMQINIERKDKERKSPSNVRMNHDRVPTGRSESSRLRENGRRDLGLQSIKYGLERRRSSDTWRSRGPLQGSSRSRGNSPIPRRLSSACERRSPSELFQGDRKMRRVSQQDDSHARSRSNSLEERPGFCRTGREEKRTEGRKMHRVSQQEDSHACSWSNSQEERPGFRSTGREEKKTEGRKMHRVSQQEDSNACFRSNSQEEKPGFRRDGREEKKTEGRKMRRVSQQEDSHERSQSNSLEERLGFRRTGREENKTEGRKKNSCKSKRPEESTKSEQRDMVEKKQDNPKLENNSSGNSKKNNNTTSKQYPGSEARQDSHKNSYELNKKEIHKECRRSSNKSLTTGSVNVLGTIKAKDKLKPHVNVSQQSNSVPMQQKDSLSPKKTQVHSDVTLQVDKSKDDKTAHTILSISHDNSNLSCQNNVTDTNNDHTQLNLLQHKSTQLQHVLEMAPRVDSSKLSEKPEPSAETRSLLDKTNLTIQTPQSVPTTCTKVIITKRRSKPSVLQNSETRILTSIRSNENELSKLNSDDLNSSVQNKLIPIDRYISNNTITPLKTIDVSDGAYNKVHIFRDVSNDKISDAPSCNDIPNTVYQNSTPLSRLTKGRKSTDQVTYMSPLPDDKSKSQVTINKTCSTHSDSDINSDSVPMRSISERLVATPPDFRQKFATVFEQCSQESNDSTDDEDYFLDISSSSISDCGSDVTWKPKKGRKKKRKRNVGARSNRNSKSKKVK